MTSSSTSPVAALPARAAPWTTTILPMLRGPLLIGGLIVVAFFGIFGGWAALAPLSSGAIASGLVNPESSRKVIQHLEGGIIGAIHVSEGQRVAAGDRLITLESTRQSASFTAGHEQWLRLLVVRARLEAHATGADMVVPAEAEASSDPGIQAFIANTRNQFLTEQRAQLQIVDISARQIEQLESEIASIKAETAGLQIQKGLVDAQLADAERLLEQQLISRNQVAAMQRDQAQLASAIAANDGRLARAGQQIEESKLTLLQSQEAFRIKISEETTQINNQIAVLAADLESVGDVLRRTEIVSPVDGVVLNLRYETVGGVVTPGDTIMDVVPLDDDMIVVARLSPRDIDLVTPGQLARVSLLPFASRNLLPLEGEVLQVAADITIDEVTGQPYYELRVRVPASELAKHDGLYMGPGMPADVTIVTGERTMLQYLLEPLMRAINAAFVYD